MLKEHYLYEIGRNTIVRNKRLTNHNEDNEKQKRGYCEEI